MNRGQVLVVDVEAKNYSKTHSRGLTKSSSIKLKNAEVDVKVLAKAPLAYDLKQNGKDILEIGLTVTVFDKKEFVDWVADDRTASTA